MRRGCSPVAACLLLGVTGCPAPQAVPGTPAPAPVEQVPNEYTHVLEKLLTDHGEKKVVVEGAAVRVAGRNAVFLGRTESVSTQGTSTRVEAEFRTTLPDGRVIHDFIAGVSGDESAARNDAIANFVLSSFHVLYAALINPADTHLLPQKETVQGKVRAFYVGDLYVRGKSTDAARFRTISTAVQQLIKANLPDDDKIHWVKVVYGATPDRVIAAEMTLDNIDTPALTSALKGLPWPKTESVYIFKQFVLIK